MSDFVEVRRAVSVRNGAGSFGRAAVARCVHSCAPVMLIVLAAMLAGGCPPPPLSLDEPDARGNQVPGIVSVRGDDGEEFTVGIPNQVIRTLSTMDLTLVDPDLEDTLYVRAFFDYTEADGMATPRRSGVDVAPSEPRSLTRTVTCNLSSFCRSGDDQNGPHRMDIVVSDRRPDDDGVLAPLTYFDVPPPGLQARRTYLVTCVEPSP
jgi:hypothetical protein